MVLEIEAEAGVGEGCLELAELQFFDLPPAERDEARVLAALSRESRHVRFAGAEAALPKWKTFKVDLGPCEGVRCADTGELISPELVKAGREKEVAELKAFGVFEFIRGQDALRFKQVRCRWVDRLKKGACRSRFVAMEFANSIRDALYAGTPLLGGVRLSSLRPPRTLRAGLGIRSCPRRTSAARSCTPSTTAT